MKSWRWVLAGGALWVSAGVAMGQVPDDASESAVLSEPDQRALSEATTLREQVSALFGQQRYAEAQVLLEQVLELSRRANQDTGCDFRECPIVLTERYCAAALSAFCARCASASHSHSGSGQPRASA